MKENVRTILTFVLTVAVVLAALFGLDMKFEVNDHTEPVEQETTVDTEQKTDAPNDVADLEQETVADADTTTDSPAQEEATANPADEVTEAENVTEKNVTEEKQEG
jgi:Ca2+/H+ antiporter